MFCSSSLEFLTVNPKWYKWWRSSLGWKIKINLPQREQQLQKWPNQLSGSVSTRMNSLTSSAVPKGLKDDRRQLKWMITDYFLCQEKQLYINFVDLTACFPQSKTLQRDKPPTMGSKTLVQYKACLERADSCVSADHNCFLIKPEDLPLPHTSPTGQKPSAG